MDAYTPEKRLLYLEAWIRENQTAALARFSEFSPGASLHSFHAHIGRNNNTFVDSVRTRFSGPQEFVARWIEGLHATLDDLKSQGRTGYGGRPLSEHLVFQCLQDDLLRQYTFRFLERNFYRNYKERTRNKPDDALWRVWFGSGDLSWGLIIAPAHRNNIWTNDKSQMRRENYTYWTIGHVLATGLHDPTTNSPVTFSSVEGLSTFYRSVLKRVSNSLYERAICDRYLNYLARSYAPLDEPLLIPEFRYAGAERKHEYRLDFTVLNGHTFRFTGYELSPASTHMKAEKVAGKTQAELNRELAATWQREVGKRNAYFQTYGVSVMTFADDDLKDMDKCFERIETELRARTTPTASVQDALAALSRGHSAA
jgi:hypothetical protein